MSDPVAQAFKKLQLEYLASFPHRMEELRSDLARLRAGDAEARASIKVRLHRLAGSGGSYGFVHLSSIAREAESCLASAGSPAGLDQLEQIVERLARAADEAEVEMKRRVSG